MTINHFCANILAERLLIFFSRQEEPNLQNEYISYLEYSMRQYNGEDIIKRNKFASLCQMSKKSIAY
jgi:hypothetical protein